MKRFTTLVSGKRNKTEAPANTNDPPETAAVKAVKSFCESGAAGNSGEEVLHLPVLVDAAESSPQAAAAAAYQIRKYISDRYKTQPQIQYNAVMLIGILSNNPGQSFTQNVDKKFRDTVRGLLVNSRDPSVQTIMRETLGTLEMEKANDANLAPLIEMWRATKNEMQQSTSGYNTFATEQAQLLARSGPRHRSRVSNRLPPPAELGGRVEEARTTAKLLMQLSQSTPPAEIADSELAKEFAERCQSALQNLQGYMNCTDPSPDEQTFQTLIETCEQLNVASSKYQRALLAGRRLASDTPPSVPQGGAAGYFAPPAAQGVASPPARAAPVQSSQTQLTPPTQPPPPPPNGVDSRQRQAPPNEGLGQPTASQPTETQAQPAATALLSANRKQADPFGDQHQIQRDGYLVGNGVSAAQEAPGANASAIDPSGANDAPLWQQASPVEPADRPARTRTQPPPITTSAAPYRSSVGTGAAYDDDLYGMSAPASQQRSQQMSDAFASTQTPHDVYAAQDAYATPQRREQDAGQGDFSYPTPASDFPYPSPIGGGAGAGADAGAGNGARRIKDDDPMPAESGGWRY